MNDSICHLKVFQLGRENEWMKRYNDRICVSGCNRCFVSKKMNIFVVFFYKIRDRRQIPANIADWLVESYLITNLISSIINVAICIFRRTENYSNQLWRTNQRLDDIAINQSIGKISHNLATAPKKTRFYCFWLYILNSVGEFISSI